MSLTLQSTELAPLVARALGKPSLEIVEWRCDPLTAGGSVFAGGKGLYRVTGTARDHEGMHPWSMILKVASGVSQYAGQEPASRNYWRREAVAYASGLLDALPGGHLVAPRCYAVEERPDSEVWVWLEEIQPTGGKWDMARYARTARHMGQFNGAYLAGYPLPEAQPWMTKGRTRVWIEDVREGIALANHYMESPFVQRWFGEDGMARTLNVWDKCQELLEVFDRLPLCYCHHDAHHRNLLERQRSDGMVDTVAIDWALTGFGRVGEEAGVTMSVGLELLEVAASRAEELDQTVFAGYLDGLRDAGWQGDARLARLGYTVNACLGTVLGNFYWLDALQSAEGIEFLNSFVGNTVDAMIDQWTVTLPFCLELGDEAMALARLGLV